MKRITDYQSLVEAIHDLVILDIGDEVDGYLQLVENDIGRRLETNWQEYTETVVIVPNGIFFEDDKRGILRILLAETPLALLNDDVARQTYKNATDSQPVAYSVVGGEVGYENQLHVKFYPTPPEESTYTADITYKLVVPALTDVNTTNWVLRTAPDAYLYGAAIHAVVYNGDTTSKELYQQQYEFALTGVFEEVDRYQSMQRSREVTGTGGYASMMP